MKRTLIPIDLLPQTIGARQKKGFRFAKAAKTQA
jgi:hypothetical protein